MTPESSEPSEPLELPEEIVRDLAREEIPDDDVVVGYITRGALAAYVEGVAACNAEFCEELVACIDGLDEAGEVISDVARAWRTPPDADYNDEQVDYGAAELAVAEHAHAPSDTGADYDDAAVPALAVPTAESTESAQVVELAPRARRPMMVGYVVLALAAGFLLFVGGGFFRHQREEADRAQAEKEQENLQKQAELDALMRRLEAQKQELAIAQAEAANASDDADRAAAQAKLRAAQEQMEKSQANIAAAKSGAVKIGASDITGVEQEKARQAPAPSPAH